MPASLNRGTGGPTATSPRSINGANSAPAVAPNAERTRLSVRSIRATRADDAPSTVRSTASRDRPATRTSVRLATLRDRDEQDERDRRPEQPERLTGVTEHGLAQRVRRHPRRAVLKARGPLREDPLADDSQIPGRRFERDTVLEPRYDAHIERTTALGRRNLESRPQLSANPGEISHALTQYANDRVCHAIDRHGLADSG